MKPRYNPTQTLPSLAFELCFHTGVVKMRRGETAKYVQLLGNMGDLYRAFELFSGRLASQ